MKEPVIAYSKVSDTIQLEGVYNFPALVTIGLAEGGDFYLVLEFLDLNINDFKILAHFCKLPRALKINSKLIEKEKYNITHIVITKVTSNNMLQMTWECLSDDPKLYNCLNIK